jgi:hypothetical protein
LSIGVALGQIMAARLMAMVTAAAAIGLVPTGACASGSFRS